MIKVLKKGDYALDDVLIRDRSGRDVSQVVADIIFGVKMGGDPTLINYSQTFDGPIDGALELTKEEIDAAVAEVPEEVMETLQEAADRIAFYHKAQLKEGYVLEEDGVKLCQKVIPLKRVGIYIPGGTAAYPSTVLMNAIPAKIAGVGEIVMVSPPSKDGCIAPVILAAAKIAGVDRVFRIGGAQAVAALAYGTESVPMVDKIVGPGNAYVAEAKRQVFGQVGIDLIAGPSEVLVIADNGSDARIVAADMLSQAEHDRMATAVLITTDQSPSRSTARSSSQIQSMRRSTSPTSWLRSIWNCSWTMRRSTPTRSKTPDRCL